MTEPRQVHTAVEHLVARVLLVGGLAGLVLIALGLGIYAAHGGFHHQVLVLKREPGAPPPGSSARCGRSCRASGAGRSTRSR